MAKAKTWGEALATLAKPVPQKFVKQKPDKSKADYVPHHIIRQYLHAILDSHAFRPVDVLKKGEGEYAVLLELEATVGGETRTFRGWGESENRKAPIKSAESDAVKRIAAMDLGLGLHLWSRDHYFLPKALAEDLEGAASEAAEKDAEYGGDGDEATAEEPATPTAEEAAATIQKELGGERAEGKAKGKPAAKRTAAQNRKLQALRGDLWIEDDAWQSRLQELYGVTSSADLTKDQAADLITKLEARKAAAATA